MARGTTAALLLILAASLVSSEAALGAGRRLTQVPGLASIVAGAVSSVNNLTNTGTAAALSNFRGNVSNWDYIAEVHDIQGWNDSSADTAEICTWTGMVCGGTGGTQILGLSLPNLGLEGQLADWNFSSFRQLNLSGNVFSGTLPESWGTTWSSMTTIDVSTNNITGTLPGDWGGSGSFLVLSTLLLHNNALQGTLPETWGTNLNNVTSLDLTQNLLTGTLPAAWGVGTGFGAMVSLSVADNLLSGSLPNTWGQQSGMPALRFFNASHNAFSGTVPGEWGNVPLKLNGLDVGNNTLTGTLPPSFAYMSLYNLSVAGNLIQGSLPTAWGTSGLWNPMARLLVDHNNLTGTLPSTWGTNGSMAALSFMAVNNNSMSGAIPTTWTNRFATGFTLILTPGNSLVCGGIPTNLQVASQQSFSGNYGVLTQTPTGTCPPSPPPPPVASPPPAVITPSTKSSGLGGGAIAGIIIGALAGLAVLAALLFFLCRKRRRDGFSKQKSTVGPNSVGSLPKSEEYRHLQSGSVAPSSIKSTDTTQNGRKMDSDEMLSGGTTRTRRGTTVEMSNPESAIHSTPNRSLASTQEWTDSPAARARGDAFQLPHSFEWRIEPQQLKIAKRPDGRDHKLGAGGFGTVYKAYKDDVQEVAVKIFKPEEGGAQAVESSKFQMEIAIMKGCRDRNIVQFYGACISDEQLYMVTEFMENGDLFTAINNAERGPSYQWYKKGRKIALGVARGLHYLHSNSVIHFDLKSANILLAADDSAKLADVGLSHALTTKTHVVNSVMRGTWSWAAPETITGLKCTEKVDIWSYGIVLWELCTLEQPERGRNRPVRVPEECPKEIDQLIASCTDPDPNVRPTAKQIIQQILKSPAEPPAS